MNSKISILIIATILALGVASTSADAIVAPKNLAGVKCFIDLTYNIEYYANSFTYDIEVCNVPVSVAVNSVNEYIKFLTTITGKIIDISDMVCKNAAYEETDAAKVPPGNCATDIQNQMTMLSQVVGLTQTALASVTDTNACVKEAIPDLKLQLESFNTAVAACTTFSNKF